MKSFINIIVAIAFSLACNGQGKAMVAMEKMVNVPAGSYKPFFITPDSKPVSVAAFRMSETAVTNAQFLEFVKANPQWRRSKVNRLFADTNYLRQWESDLSIGEKNKNIYNSPVVNVSWFAAQAYCKWKQGRLPSVAEWELAAKGSPVNMKSNSLTDYVLNWYTKPNLPVLPNVRSTYKNEYGLYDMNGLIWEWTFNFNSFISSQDSRGNAEDELKNFCAGGALNVADKSDYATFLRFSYRGSLKGNFCIANLGFRCVKDLK
jgi:formylglycine-generating enzyme required for sulfatase activity